MRDWEAGTKELPPPPQRPPIPAGHWAGDSLSKTERVALAAQAREDAGWARAVKPADPAAGDLPELLAGFGSLVSTRLVNAAVERAVAFLANQEPKAQRVLRGSSGCDAPAWSAHGLSETLPEIDPLFALEEPEEPPLPTPWRDAAERAALRRRNRAVLSVWAERCRELAGPARERPAFDPEAYAAQMRAVAETMDRTPTRQELERAARARERKASAVAGMGAPLVDDPWVRQVVARRGVAAAEFNAAAERWRQAQGGGEGLLRFGDKPRRGKHPHRVTVVPREEVPPEERAELRRRRTQALVEAGVSP